MLRRLFGMKPKPPTLPLEYRKPTIPASTAPASAITDGNTSASIVIQDITDANFADVVLQSDCLTVVDVWAEWCQPCTIMSAYTEWLARDYRDALKVVALDADENPATPEQYTIMGLPTLLFFRNGVEVDRQVGLLSYEELQAKVDALLTV